MRMIKHLAAIAMLLYFGTSLTACSSNEETKTKAPEEDASQFVVLTDVVPDVILEIRYYSTYNFIGRRIPGYEEPIAMLTRQAADSLKKVSDDLIKQGYRLKIFDRSEVGTHSWQHDRPHTLRHDIRKGSRHGLHLRLLRRGITPRRTARTTHRRLQAYHPTTIRQPNDTPEGHDITRFQALRLRVVALHAFGRALPQHLLHIPNSP